MTNRKLYWNFICILFFWGCASTPGIVPGKGAIYGKVAANAHKLLRQKAAKSADAEYSIKGEVHYTKEMVNYPGLKEIYVCLI